MTTSPTPDHEHHDDHDIGCLEALERFYAYLDGELDPAAAEDLERHMQHCLSCYSRAELERRVTERMREAASKPASEALRRRVRGLFDDLEEDA